MTEVEIANFIENQLHVQGYRAERLEGNAIGSTASGFKFYIQLYETSIQFRCLISLMPESGKWLEFVNSFNKKMRFVKVYMEDDESLLAEADWWLDSESINQVEQFNQAMEFWELSLSELKDNLREQLNIVGNSADDTK